MLVVLADYSDDDGNSFPSVATLARKCRMSSRNANYILGALQASGELIVFKNAGLNGSNRYRIVLSALGQSGPLKPTSPLKAIAPLQSASPLKEASPLKPTSAIPAAGVPIPLKPTSDKPSLNRQGPSLTSKLPLCRTEAVVELFHEALPELPRIKLMDKKRLDAIKAFWSWVLKSKKSDGTKRAETAEQALKWIRGYFERARANDFLMGRTARSEAHSNWKCDLDYLLTERGRIQVIEKTTEAQT
jgi:hypothetical protein